MTTEVTSDIIETNGVLVGPYLRPRNLAQHQRGSIHDDAMAQRLGFRGGTVAGSIHMEQFPPILLRAFGERWFETGTLSTYFRNATTDGEPVRTLAQAPAGADADAQIRVWMEKEDGTTVLEGTASIGNPIERSMLHEKLAEPRERGELRILSHLAPGFVSPTVIARLDPADIAPRLAALTAPLPWYEGASPWGAAIANPGLMVHLMVAVQDGLELGRNPAVGLYGAIEVRQISGPVFIDHEYDVTGTILAVGTTPKTEYVWYQSALREPGTGTDVASMLMMLRFMKASSKLWLDSPDA